MNNAPRWYHLDSEQPCYHQTFVNNTNMEEYKWIHQQMGDILAQRMQPLADISKQSKLNTKVDPGRLTDAGKKSIDSLHFEFWRDDVFNEQKHYARKLTTIQ